MQIYYKQNIAQVWYRWDQWSERDPSHHRYDKCSPNKKYPKNAVQRKLVDVLRTVDVKDPSSLSPAASLLSQSGITQGNRSFTNAIINSSRIRSINN